MCPDGPVGPQGLGVAGRFTFVHSTRRAFFKPHSIYRHRYKYGGPQTPRGHIPFHLHHTLSTSPLWPKLSNTIPVGISNLLHCYKLQLTIAKDRQRKSHKNMLDRCPYWSKRTSLTRDRPIEPCDPHVCSALPSMILSSLDLIWRNLRDFILSIIFVNAINDIFSSTSSSRSLDT